MNDIEYCSLTNIGTTLMGWDVEGKGRNQRTPKKNEGNEVSILFILSK